MPGKKRPRNLKEALKRKLTKKEMEALTTAVEKEEKVLEEQAKDFTPASAEEQFDFD